MEFFLTANRRCWRVFMLARDLRFYCVCGVVSTHYFCRTIPTILWSRVISDKNSCNWTEAFEYVVKMRPWPLTMRLVVDIVLTTFQRRISRLDYDVLCGFCLDSMQLTVSASDLAICKIFIRDVKRCSQREWYVRWPRPLPVKRAHSATLTQKIHHMANIELGTRNVLSRWFRSVVTLSSTRQWQVLWRRVSISIQ